MDFRGTPPTIRSCFQTNEINHSGWPKYEIHGNIVHFNTGINRCPFLNAFLGHESRVRGFHPIGVDQSVRIALQGRDSGVHNGAGRRDNGGDPGTGDTGLARSLVKVIMCLETRHHLSWKDCVIEDTSWD